MAKLITPRNLNIYGDDSSTEQRYVIYGTLSCETEDAPSLIGELTQCTGPSEFKWNELSRFHYDAYERFVDTIFDWIERRRLSFRCIVADTSKANYKEFTQGSRTLALEKFIFCLLYTYAQDHSKRPCSIFTRLDEGDPNHPPALQREYLNRRDRNEHGREDDIFKLLVHVRSKDCILVQAVDVVTGAIGYVTNKHHLSDEASAYKMQLARRIAKHAKCRVTDRAAISAGIKTGDLETLGLPIERHIGRVRGFGIWHLDWGKEREKEMRALSRDQLSHFPQTLTFADVRAQGYRVDMVCSRCSRAPREDYLRYAAWFGERRIDNARRPSCNRPLCQGEGVVLLEPDPLLPLFAPAR